MFKECADIQTADMLKLPVPALVAGKPTNIQLKPSGIQEQVLRKVLMDAPLLERPTADYIKMSRQIAALGNNLNQLAHIANASGKVSNTDLLTAKQIMEQIWRYIKGGGVQ